MESTVVEDDFEVETGVAGKRSFKNRTGKAFFDGRDIFLRNSSLRNHRIEDKGIFVSFDFDPGLGDDPSFRLTPLSPINGNLLVLGFGDFNGIAGSRAIGTVTFDAVGVGVANLSTGPNAQPAGPFVSAASPLDLLLVGFEASTVTVVPEPSTLGLLILGSGGLVLLGSKGGARRIR